MNAVGIDVSKGKSTVAVMRPFGEIVAMPFDVNHTSSELSDLAAFISGLNGETRVIMEYTGVYYQPIARYLYDAGISVSVVHPMLIHNYGNNSIRRVKTDKKDAIKIANYGLDHWVYLTPYTPEEEIRLALKTYNRQYYQYMNLKVALKNNLISLLDHTFPGINSLFSSPVRKDGHEKWVDFVAQFWHVDCVLKMSEAKFTERYNKWCEKAGYKRSLNKAEQIYAFSSSLVSVLPMNDATKHLILCAIKEYNSISETLAMLKVEMQRIASQLPEYDVVMSIYGVGEALGPQLMAEIGDVRRFHSKQSLVAYAGVDAPPFQSGKFEAKKRSISKRGSPLLRKELFQLMACLMQNAPADDPVYQFLDRKRAEGKHFYVYMIAGCNKFLRIYYARVKESLEQLEQAC